MLTNLFTEINSTILVKRPCSFCPITATLFGQLWRLEPLPPEKKSMWRREMDWLLCVGDHVVELVPTWQTFPDGSKLEVRLLFQNYMGIKVAFASMN